MRQRFALFLALIGPLLMAGCSSGRRATIIHHGIVPSYREPPNTTTTLPGGIRNEPQTLRLR